MATNSKRGHRAPVSPRGLPQTRKTPVMVRFHPELLKRVDRAAKRRGISRSSWIQFVISKTLEQGEL